MSQDRFEGSLLGLALGDALGAPFEGGTIEQFAWRVLGTTRSGAIRWTDDTQMSLDVAESLIAQRALDPDDLAQRFARSYRWSRGYGPGAARLLKRIARGADWREANRSIYKEGSFGNGGAMRAPVVGLFYAARPDELIEAARASALVTHAHPLGIEGTLLVAAATACALTSSDPTEILGAAAAHCDSPPFRKRIEVARSWLGADGEPDSDSVVEDLGNGIAAAESCITALYVALRFLDASFDELHDFVVECGGDVDTIGAMSGAIWGAANSASALPQEQLERLEDSDRLRAVAASLYRTSVAAARELP